MNTKNRIFVAVLNQGSVFTGLSEALAVMRNNPDYDVEIEYFDEKPISYNRNLIVQRFLSKGHDYLLMLDSDNVPPPSVINLADYKKDVVGALYFMWSKGEIMPTAFDRSNDGMYSPIKIDDKDGMVECDAVGTGIIMLSKKVLKEIKSPFSNEYDADGIKLFGLDIAFCRKAKEKGYKVYVNLDYVCDHWVVVNLKRFYAIIYGQVDRIKERETEIEKLKEEIKQFKGEESPE